MFAIWMPVNCDGIVNNNVFGWLFIRAKNGKKGHQHVTVAIEKAVVYHFEKKKCLIFFRIYSSILSLCLHQVLLEPLS